MLGEEEGAALDDEDARLRIVLERLVGKPEGAETRADDDKVEVVLFADLLPVGLRDEEHMVHDG